MDTGGLIGQAAFEKARKKGYVNDPDDKGGETMCGVTLYTFRSYFGQSKTGADLKNMSYAQWRFIMKKYWDRCKADSIRNQSIAEIFVDWHVNAGVSAIRKVQTYFGLKCDGIVGGQTIGALNGPDSKTIFERIKTARTAYYNKLCITTPTNKKFLKGWLNRTNSFTFIY